MDDIGPSGGGIFASLKRLANTALTAFQNRIELLAVELQEETNWVVSALIWTSALLFFGIMAVLVLTAAVIYVFPDEYRVYVLAAFFLFYLLLGVWAFLGLKRHLKARRPPFSATIGEIKKDIAAFTSDRE